MTARQDSGYPQSPLPCSDASHEYLNGDAAAPVSSSSPPVSDTVDVPVPSAAPPDTPAPAYADVIAAPDAKETDVMLTKKDGMVTSVTKCANGRTVPCSPPRILNVSKRASVEKSSFLPRVMLINAARKRASLDIYDSPAATRTRTYRPSSAGGNHQAQQQRSPLMRCDSDAVSPTISDLMRCRSPSSSLMTPASTGGANPLITITVEPDHDSLFQDYISPDVPRMGGVTGNKDTPLFVGDDVSLFGGPREDLSPIKESSSPTYQSTTDFLKDQLVAFFQPSDNKLAMKLFGSKNALNRERRRQKEAGNWVIHPCSNFRSVT